MYSAFMTTQKFDTPACTQSTSKLHKPVVVRICLTLTRKHLQGVALLEAQAIHAACMARATGDAALHVTQPTCVMVIGIRDTKSNA